MLPQGNQYRCCDTLAPSSVLEPNLTEIELDIDSSESVSVLEIQIPQAARVALPPDLGTTLTPPSPLLARIFTSTQVFFPVQHVHSPVM